MSVVKLHRQTQALEGTITYDDRRDKNEMPLPRALSVALSGEVGTPASAVAQEVGRRMGWPVHDEDILQHIAADLGINIASLEKEFDERRRSWLLEWLEALSSRPRVAEYVYVRRLMGEFRTLAAQGHGVFVGHGAAQALPHESTLRVRIIGTPEHRADQIVQRLRVSRPDALRMLDRIEDERAAFIHEHFNRDPRDIRFYDLVVNSSLLDAGECAAVIIEGVHQREAEACRAQG
jgi:cytidylate kinase